MMGRIKMVATEGMVLTNGEIYGKTVFLGNGDSPDNWREITDEEFEKRQTDDTEDVATEDDYRSALRELGVKV